jgi:hypothetical protein
MLLNGAFMYFLLTLIFFLNLFNQLQSSWRTGKDGNTSSSTKKSSIFFRHDQFLFSCFLKFQTINHLSRSMANLACDPIWKERGF